MLTAMRALTANLLDLDRCIIDLSLSVGIHAEMLLELTANPKAEDFSSISRDRRSVLHEHDSVHGIVFNLGYASSTGHPFGTGTSCFGSAVT